MTAEFTGPDGHSYGLGHLKTQRYEIKLKIEEQHYDVPVVLTFSNHCYTNDQNDDTTPAKISDAWYCLTDNKSDRVFCKKRWKASIALPAYLHIMMQHGLDCYKTTRAGNSIRIHDNDMSEKYAGWYVFFQFTASNGRGPGIVRINVTSHHHRHRLPDSVRSTVKFKFDSLMAQWCKERPEIMMQLLPVPKI